MMVQGRKASNLKVSNLTGTSATISWVTVDPTSTKLKFTVGDTESTYKDDRDNEEVSKERHTHIVTLKGLTPSENYSFSIGDDFIPLALAFNSFTTFAISEHIDNPQVVYGRVSLAEGNDFDDVLIHFTVNTENQERPSAEYSAVVNKDGNWAAEVTSIRDEVGAMYFDSGEVAALLDRGSEEIMAGVLGENTWDEETTKPEGAIDTNYITLTATNGIIESGLYIPLNNSISTTIFSTFLNNSTDKSVLGEETIVAYDPDEKNTVRCNDYSFNTDKICTNDECPRDRACAANFLTSRDVEKCLAIGSENMILDCCLEGWEIKDSACVQETKKEYCSGYGSAGNVGKVCNNVLCGLNKDCRGYPLDNADKVKCLANGTQNIIVDCCAEGQIVENNKICVDEKTPTSEPTKKPTNTPTNTPINTATPSPTAVATATLTVTATETKGDVSSCRIFQPTNTSSDLQKMMDDISTYISSKFSLKYVKIPVKLQEEGSGCWLEGGIVNCYRPKQGARWLNNKLLFHEAMHYYKSAQGVSITGVVSELMASFLETYFVAESDSVCPGGLYTFYTISNPNVGLTASEIRKRAGLGLNEMVKFAIYGDTKVFNEPVVQKIDSAGWDFKHIYCNGFSDWTGQKNGSGACTDQPRTVTSAIKVQAKPVINADNINDIDKGEYRIDLLYKTLKNGISPADKTISIRIGADAKNNGNSFELANKTIDQLYIKQGDDSTNLKVKLYSEKVNNNACDSKEIDISNYTDGQEYVIDLTSLSCSFEFDVEKPVGGSCKIDDIIKTGIIPPWENVSGAFRTQGYKDTHKAIDVATKELNQPLLAAGGGIVKYVRAGNVQDSVFFGQQQGKGKCASIDNNYCVCDWCTIDDVRANENAIQECSSYGCVARAEELRSTGNIFNWGFVGGLDVKYGNVVVIEHANSETVYGHLNQVFLKPGDCVNAGDVIGTLGNTGSSSNAHIHFEIRAKNGAPTNPDGFGCKGNKCSGFVKGIATTNAAEVLGEEFEEHALFETDYDLSQQSAFFGKGIFSATSELLSIDRLVVGKDGFIPEVFIDKNNNSLQDSDETIIDARYLGVEFDKTQAIEDINFNPSWKLVSFNAVNSEIKTTEDLARQVNLTGIKTELASYITDKWDIAAIKETGSLDEFYGNYFLLQPGDAYFIRADINATYYNTGDIVKDINKELELSVGWNFFSFSQDVLDATNITSYTILDKCNQAGLVCSLFAGYDGQLENSVVVKDTYYGKDYQLKANTGYILKVENGYGKVSFN